MLPDQEADSSDEDADSETRELERGRDEEFTELSKASNNSPRGIWSDGDVPLRFDSLSPQPVVAAARAPSGVRAVARRWKPGHSLARKRACGLGRPTSGRSLRRTGHRGPTAHPVITRPFLRRRTAARRFEDPLPRNGHPILTARPMTASYPVSPNSTFSSGTVRRTRGCCRPVNPQTELHRPIRLDPTRDGDGRAA